MRWRSQRPSERKGWSVICLVWVEEHGAMIVNCDKVLGRSLCQCDIVGKVLSLAQHWVSCVLASWRHECSER